MEKIISNIIFLIFQQKILENQNRVLDGNHTLPQSITKKGFIIQAMKLMKKS